MRKKQNVYLAKDGNIRIIMKAPDFSFPQPIMESAIQRRQIVTVLRQLQVAATSTPRPDFISLPNEKRLNLRPIQQLSIADMEEKLRVKQKKAPEAKAQSHLVKALLSVRNEHIYAREHLAGSLSQIDAVLQWGPNEAHLVQIKVKFHECIQCPCSMLSLL